MKARDYRNPKVQARLDQAAKTWLLDDPKRSFQEPEAISVSQIVRWFLYGSLLFLVFLFLWFSKEDGRLFLAVILPVVAIMTFLRMARIQAAPGSSEVIHLLPLDDQTLTHQVRRDLRRPFIEGLILSSILGAFGAEVVICLTGALQGLLIFLGLLGCLGISYYWRFFEIFTLLSKGCGGLLFAGMVIDRLEGFNRSLLEATPWFQAFNSPLILSVFLSFGVATAWFTKNHWSKITRFNRTVFYQNHKAINLEVTLKEEDDSEEATVSVSDFSSPPTQPQGPLERLTWRYLTIKERGLLRGIGGNSTNFLAAWIKTTSVFLLVLWLTRFHWPPFIEPIRSAAPIIVLSAMTFFTGLCSSPPTRYLHGIIIGPHTTAPRFQALPLTLTALEKLMWKVNFPRCVLMALTIAFASLIEYFFQASLQSFAVTLLVFIALIFHIFWIHFWASSINGRASRQGRIRVWIIFIQIVLAFGIIATLAFSIFFLTIFQGMNAPWSSSKAGIMVAVVIGYHLILRLLVRTLISDTQSDLVGQD